MKMKRFALISVYNKEGLKDLAKRFVALDLSIIATGGTARYLKEFGFGYTPIEGVTGNPESFDGRMKTISFEIEAGILFDRTNKKHVEEARILKIPQIDFVVCNFYPFWEKPELETIDIGGPTMVRAAAKNYEHVTVLVDPSDYSRVTDALSVDTKKQLAVKALSYVADYDIRIANYFQGETGEKDRHFISMDKGIVLRYGENPHQKGYLYQDLTSSDDLLNLGGFRILQGKQMSFNNLLDASAGLETISLIGKEEPAVTVIKHTNPCGAAVGTDLADAFKKAWFNGDPLAAFGGVIVVNRAVTGEVAKLMLADKKFFEVLAAPEFEEEALSIFAQKPKLQLWKNEKLRRPRLVSYEDIKKIRGGYLIQDGDIYEIEPQDFKVVTKKKPTKEQREDLVFAWKIVQVSKSNAVAAVKNRILLSSGVGQQDRKRCAELCVIKALQQVQGKAGKSLRGAVAATDGFFPFRDGPDVLMKAGVVAIAQPGGSIRDKEVIAACDEQGVAMVFTGVRNFRH